MFSCGYMETLDLERQDRRQYHQGFFKSPQTVNTFQAFDLRAEQIVRLPETGPQLHCRLILFFIATCEPSMTHLNYLSNYASRHRHQVEFPDMAQHYNRCCSLLVALRGRSLSFYESRSFAEANESTPRHPQLHGLHLGTV
jgi:hypothetical protein